MVFCSKEIESGGPESLAAMFIFHLIAGQGGASSQAFLIRMEQVIYFLSGSIDKRMSPEVKSAFFIGW